MSDEKLKAKLIRPPDGTRIELFRVIQTIGEGVRVEIQGFSSSEPAEIGFSLAQAAEILAQSMAEIFSLRREEALAQMVGAMVASLVSFSSDIASETRRVSAMRGEEETRQ